MTNLRIKALAFAMALFLVSNILAADFANDFEAHFGDIFANKLANWQWYAALAISICFFFNLVLYMAGKALMSDHLQKYALSEFMQVTASALMIAFAVGLLYGFSTGQGGGMDLMRDVIGTNSAVACGEAPNGVFSIWKVDPNFGVGPLGAFRCKLQEKITALDGAYDMVYEGNKMNEVWSSTCVIVFGIPIYCGDWDIAVHKRMEEAHLIETKIVSLLVPLHAMYSLSMYIENNMLAVFLPVGLVLRILPLTRGVGGLLIAIALGMFFVWPTFLILTDPTFVKAEEAPDPNAARSEGMCFTGFKGTAVLVQTVVAQLVTPGSAESLAIDNGKTLVYQLTISIMFYPFVAFVITLAFIRSLTPLLGGDMGEFMKMVGRLG
ncbi:MAG: hypothetical protein WCT52_05660 [Candidatus Micrarchaeia archaeon]